LMYAQDWDEILPWYADRQDCKKPRLMWWQIIMPYVKNEAVFKCPDVQLRGSGCYKGIGVVYPHVIACGWGAGTNLANLKTPGSTAMFADAAVWPSGSWSFDCPFPLVYCAADYGVTWTCYLCGNGPTNKNPVCIDFRHNNAANVGFCDGHVRPIHPPGPFLDKNHPEFYDIWGHPKPA